MVHPLELSLSFDDSARYAGYLTALEAVAPKSYVERFSEARLVWDDAENFDERALEISASDLNDEIQLNIYRSKTLHPEQGVPLLDKITAMPGFPEQNLVEVWNAMATILASLGRLEEARQYYDTVWAISGPMGNLGYSRMLPVWAGLADSAYAAQQFEAMAGMQVEGALQRQGSLYGDMLWALARGRSGEARRFATEALAIKTTGPNTMLPLLKAGQGWADIIDGDTLAGIEAMRGGLEEAGYSGGFVMAMNLPLRYALAAAQSSYPATREEGIRRLRNGIWMLDIIYVPLTYLWLGQALEAEGDIAGAVEAYSHFVRHWAKADPELQPRVETARQAIRRLTGESAN
jgi:tetratricopeptide (TPR) repeat protein